jgi:alcohol dehydrogenase class IV
MLAIPTTSGSGSEATHFSVIYRGNEKFSIAHNCLLPTIIGFNHIFTNSLTDYQKSVSGLDALSQAIESFWSVNSTLESKLYSEIAIKILVRYLVDYVNSPNDLLNGIIQMASYYAGKSINITKTTAPHAISYSITSYFSISHGHAVFLTLPSFLKFNYFVEEIDLNDKRGEEFVRDTIKELLGLLNVENIDEGHELLVKIAFDLNIEMKLSNLGIDNLSTIVDNVNNDRLSNNPRKLNSTNLSAILEELY